MSNDIPQVEDEIEEHKSYLTEWIDGMSKLTVPESRKGVTDRFSRDCKTLIDDVDKNEMPTMADLVDYSDRRNSLEIQYLNLRSGLA